MTITVYVGNGEYIDTIEIGPEEDISDAAFEAGKEWLAENIYWECEEED